jgi:foldase protein PrsA
MQAVKRVEDVPLARVNGAEVTWSDYEATLVQMINSVSRQNGVDWSDPAMQQRMGQLQNDALQQTVDLFLLHEIAAEQGIEVDPAAVQAEIEREKSEILSSGRYADWESFLADMGLTDETFEQTISNSMLLWDVITAQEVVTQSQQLYLAHIVVEDRETAEEVHAALEAGGDFAELAAEYSLDEETKDSGGELGWFAADTTLQEIAAVAFDLEPGQYSPVIETGYGYTVILVLDREFREDEPRSILARKQAALQALLAARRSEAEIEYLVDFTAE